MDLQPQQKLGQYTVMRKLAEGGMAEIYLATKGGASGFSKTCVIKRVKAEYRSDPKFREMFESEARLAANLEHSNIVQIFDFQSTEDGELYLAMQYVEGCSLEQLRRRLPGGLLPPFLAARIARDVATALAYAYQCPDSDGQPLGLVHRDISPHNVLVSKLGEVKLTDFGVAKPVSRETSGGFKGKIAYMAPEQARGHEVDARTDIFSLGVVLFELVAGGPPFNAATDIAFIHEMGSGSSRAPRAASMGTGCPEALSDIIGVALERLPDNRYPSADEFVRALDGFMRRAQGDVDTDLARFITERVGSLTPESDKIGLLPSGAFDTRPRPPARRPGAEGPRPAQAVGAPLGEPVPSHGLADTVTPHGRKRVVPGSLDATLQDLPALNIAGVAAIQPAAQPTQKLPTPSPAHSRTEPATQPDPARQIVTRPDSLPARPSPSDAELAEDLRLALPRLLQPAFKRAMWSVAGVVFLVSAVVSFAQARQRVVPIPLTIPVFQTVPSPVIAPVPAERAAVPPPVDEAPRAAPKAPSAPASDVPPAKVVEAAAPSHPEPSPPTRRPTPAKGAAQGQAARRKFKVRFEAKPYAILTIDGKHIQQDAPCDLMLSEGRHRVKMAFPGAQARRRTIDVSRDLTVSEDFTGL